MLPVPWIGTGTQEATHSANPDRGQGILGAGRSAWGEGWAEVEGGVRNPRLPAPTLEECEPIR